MMNQDLQILDMMPSSLNLQLMLTVHGKLISHSSAFFSTLSDAAIGCLTMALESRPASRKKWTSTACSLEDGPPAATAQPH